MFIFWPFLIGRLSAKISGHPGRNEEARLHFLLILCYIGDFVCQLEEDRFQNFKESWLITFFFNLQVNCEGS